MIRKLTIKNLEYEGFKNSDNGRFIVLSDNTKIYGKNGVGKTSVGEAISWGLFGCNLYGNTRADSTLLNGNATTMYVKLLINDGENDLIILRYKNSKPSLYLAEGNDINWKMPIQMLRKVAREITQQDIDIDADAFMTIFSQEFFPNLDTERAKRIMTSFVPKVSKEVILAELSDYTNDVLKDYDLDLPNSLLAGTKKELDELNGDLKYNEGSKGTLMQLIREQENNLPQAITEEEKISLDNMDTLVSELKMIKEKWMEVKVGLKKPDLIDTNKLEKAILEYEKEIFGLSKSKDKKDLGGLIDTTNIKSNISILNNEILRLNNLLEEDGDCPTCNRPINKNELLPLIEGLESNLTIAKSELEVVEENNKIIETRHINNISNIIKEKQDSIIALNDKIKISTIENVKITQELNNNQNDALVELDSKIVEYENKVKLLQEVDTRIKNRDKMLESIAVNKEKYDKIVTEDKMIESKKVSLNVLINCIKEYNAKKVELETETINLYFKKVSLALNKVVKSSGEIKDCFELRYEGRDYKVISTGERIQVFSEISNLVLCLLGVDYPVLIDQAESVSEYESFSSQVIEAYHVKDTEFCVDNSGSFALGIMNQIAS